MFDRFPVRIVKRERVSLPNKHLHHIGHVYTFEVHERSGPDKGKVNYPFILCMLGEDGYSGFIGAEYKLGEPSVESRLDWLEEFRQP